MRGLSFSGKPVQAFVKFLNSRLLRVDLGTCDRLLKGCAIVCALADMDGPLQNGWWSSGFPDPKLATEKQIGYIRSMWKDVIGFLDQTEIVAMELMEPELWLEGLSCVRASDIISAIVHKREQKNKAAEAVPQDVPQDPSIKCPGCGRENMLRMTVGYRCPLCKKVLIHVSLK